MIVFDGKQTGRQVVLEVAIGNGWDFCSTEKEDILMTH
jgi:hypothetical protein